MTTTTNPLRDLVARRLDERWTDFSREHPNLAAAIDRLELTERAVAHLRRDPAYVAAMTSAAIDEAQLAQAAALLERVERTVMLLLPR